MEKQKKSLKQTQSMAVEQVNSACIHGNEPSYKIEGTVVYVNSVPYALAPLLQELELWGLAYRFTSKGIFVFSPLY